MPGAFALKLGYQSHVKLACALEYDGAGGQILEGYARGVEDRDVLVGDAPLRAAEYHVAYLGGQRVEHALAVRYLALAHGEALSGVVAEDPGRAEESRLQLLLAGHVRADAAQMRAGLHPVALYQRLARGGGGEYDVGRAHGGLKVPRALKGDLPLDAAAVQQRAHPRREGGQAHGGLARGARIGQRYVTQPRHGVERGGGHVRAAGVTMQGTYHDIINNLSAQIEKQLCN